MSELARRVNHAIAERRLFRRGEKFVVAVSGGLDSMVLLHLLRQQAPAEGWELTVAHFNHHLRGRSSDADARLVERTAKKLGLEWVAESADVRGLAEAEGISLEMAARKLRHGFLARAAAGVKARSIALAHHADDQVELFFLRLLRGAGAEGLAGMKWRAPSPFAPKLDLVRPLLGESKAGLRNFAKENRLAFREDATNAQRDIQRNRIRHELIPLLTKDYQPALSRVILRQMELLGAETEWLESQALAHLGAVKRRQFEKLPLALQRRCLQTQLIELGVPPNFELVEQLRRKAVQAVMVDPDRTVERDVAGALQVRSLATKEFQKLEVRFELAAEQGTLTAGGVEIDWRKEPFSGKGLSRIKSELNWERFDADKVGTSIVLRHWRPGDRFQPIGMAQPVKLQDLFGNQKVLRDRRHQLIVGVTGDGALFWVEGLRMAEGFKLDPATRRLLHWRWKRL